MGLRVAHNLVSPNVLDFVELAEEYSIVEVIASEKLEGKTLSDLDIRARFGVNVMAIKSGTHFNIAPSADDMIHEGDILVVIGHNNDLKRFEEKS